MNRSLPFPDLSTEQWNFIAVLEAFNIPVSIDLAGYLAPLLPGPLFDLLEKTQPLGWIIKHENNYFGLGKQVPTEVRNQLRAINTPDHLNHLAAKITQGDGIDKADSREKLLLLDKAGWVIEAGECEIELARQALMENQAEVAHAYLEQTVQRLMDAGTVKGVGELFVSATLDYSNLCFYLGQGFPGLEKLLLKALETVDRIGDQRSHVLLNFHLGRLYYFSDRRDDALIALSVGFEEIEALDDEDIREQSAEFLGIFFFIKGLLPEALDHFDKAEKVMHSAGSGFIINPLTPVTLGYCATFLGQFHRAIGSLDFNRRLALERSDTALASTIRAVLGTVLVLLRKDREGMVHLQQAEKEAERLGNDLGLYLSGGGIALHHFLQSRMEKAYDLLKKTLQEGISAGLIRQFASPWILEMLYEFHRLGFDPIKGLELAPLIERIISGVNIHLKGVALRLQAKEFLIKGEDRTRVEKELLESEKCLKQSGDPVQLSKTVLERARLELGRGDRKMARELLQRAKGLLGGYGEEFFPDELNHLLEQQESPPEPKGSGEGFLERYLEMIESLYPSETPSDIFAKMLTSTSRMFGAERSGLFWFPSGKYVSHPELRAARNLTLREVEAEGFKNSLRLIKKTFQTHQPQIGRFNPKESPDSILPLRSSMGIPVEIENKIHGVLYYDNSYLDDAFNFSDPSILKQMVRHTNLVIERRFHYLRIRDERNLLATEKSLLVEQKKGEMIHHSRVMMDLLKQADHLAGTESTILILGETGTGKELLAKRIHEHSPRCKEPFIVVDVTTIPENLLESELFGHERGAFTGADNRKIGRLELANQGTLFLDEIGELPLLAQTKLLRVLQEKTFHRLGGTRPISSDFRLLAATNRDLGAEVAAGRFRQDLYYRLNVIPISLPPLRDRQEDVSLLADYFIKRYAVQYKRSVVRLTDEQEKTLRLYRWPGNIRELKNIIERAVLLSAENQLELNLPADLQSSPVNPFADAPSLEEIQRRYIRHVLEKTGGRIAGAGGAAQILGMKRTSLYTRMRMLKMNNK
jgi:transcriptional regulator with GAF, ATPase, and Fis domain/tetratricopeptide (TPR) repeat protein